MQRTVSSSVFLTAIVAYFGVLLATGSAHAVHFLFFCALFSCYFLHEKTRLLILLALPFVLKNLLYDALRWVPFDFFQPIHVTGPYRMEVALFGIAGPDGLIPLSTYLREWRTAVLDLYTGLLYSIIDLYPLFTVMLLWRRRGPTDAWRFSIAHLIMNLAAFTTYLLYPVAPPWYVEHYGLVSPTGPILGDAAGLKWFESLLGISFISNTYTLSPIVFGAIPSMHVGYACCVAFYLRRVLAKSWWWILGLFVTSIAFGAVYLNHHYVIDVLAGAGYAAAAIFATERWLQPFCAFSYRLLSPIFAAASQPILWDRVVALCTALPLFPQRQNRWQEEERD